MEVNRWWYEVPGGLLTLHDPEFRASEKSKSGCLKWHGRCVSFGVVAILSGLLVLRPRLAMSDWWLPVASGGFSCRRLSRSASPLFSA